MYIHAHTHIMYVLNDSRGIRDGFAESVLDAPQGFKVHVWKRVTL